MDKNKLLNSVGKIGAKPFIILILVLLFLIPDIIADEVSPAFHQMAEDVKNILLFLL